MIKSILYQKFLCQTGLLIERKRGVLNSHRFCVTLFLTRIVCFGIIVSIVTIYYTNNNFSNWLRNDIIWMSTARAKKVNRCMVR